MEAAHIPWRPLGRLLVEQGLLSDDELELALEDQASTGRRLGEIVVELGFISHTALTHALAAQYGIELTSESGFGTGLRAEIERHHDRKRESEIGPRPHSDGRPALELVTELHTPGPPADIGEDDGLLAPLEEQWARLAAAEERLAECERELAALRRTAGRRRDQAARFARRVRRRDERIAELSALERSEAADRGGNGGSGHLVFAQLAAGYVLVERDGVAPESNTTLELPEICEGTLLVGGIGRSPLPDDLRPCVFVQQVHESTV